MSNGLVRSISFLFAVLCAISSAYTSETRTMERLRFAYVQDGALVVDVPGDRYEWYGEGEAPEISDAKKLAAQPNEKWFVQPIAESAPQALKLEKIILSSCVNGGYLAWRLENKLSNKTQVGAPAVIAYPSSLAPDGMKLKLLFAGTPKPFCVVKQGEEKNAYPRRIPTEHREESSVNDLKLTVESRDTPRDGDVFFSIRAADKYLLPFDQEYTVAVCNPASCGDTAAFQIWWATGAREKWCIILGSDGSTIYNLHEDHFDLETSYYKGP